MGMLSSVSAFSAAASLPARFSWSERSQPSAALERDRPASAFPRCSAATAASATSAGGDPRTRVGLFGLDVDLHDVRVRRKALRPMPKIQLKRPPNITMTSAPDERLGARGVGEVRVVVGDRAARHGRAHVGDAPRSTRRCRAGPASAQAAPLPNTISGRWPDARRSAVRSMASGSGCGRVTSGALRRTACSAGMRPADDIAREIEVDTAGPTLEGLAEGEMDPLADPLGGVDASGPLAEGLRGGDLVEFLEGAPAECVRERPSRRAPPAAARSRWRRRAGSGRW